MLDHGALSWARPLRVGRFSGLAKLKHIEALLGAQIDKLPKRPRRSENSKNASFEYTAIGEKTWRGSQKKFGFFNVTYQMAWDQLYASGTMHPHMAIRIRDNIVALMRAGREDAAEIAAEVVRIIIREQ